MGSRDLLGPGAIPVVSPHRSTAGVVLFDGVRRGGSVSAALDVLLDDHAAVSEQRAGQRLNQSPRVGAGVEGLHVAQCGTLAAHDASRGVDFTVQDHSAAQRHR